MMMEADSPERHLSWTLSSSTSPVTTCRRTKISLLVNLAWSYSYCFYWIPTHWSSILPLSSACWKLLPLWPDPHSSLTPKLPDTCCLCHLGLHLQTLDPKNLFHLLPDCSGYYFCNKYPKLYCPWCFVWYFWAVSFLLCGLFWCAFGPCLGL